MSTQLVQIKIKLEGIKGDDPVIAFYDGLEWGLQPTDVLTSPTSAVIGVSAIDQLHAWAVGGWGMPLATTTDGGASWQVSDHPLSAGDMNRVVAVSPTTGWTSGDYGNVLYTTDAGGTWYDAAGNEIGPEIWGDFAVIQRVYNDPCSGATGLGDGLWSAVGG